MDEQQQSDATKQLHIVLWQLDARKERLMVERQQLNAKAERRGRWGGICLCVLSALLVGRLLYVLGNRLGWW